MKTFSALFILAFVLIITGCAAYSTPEPQHPELLNKTHGFVFSPKIIVTNLDVQKITLRALDSKEIYELNYNKEGYFGLWVPAGDYEIVEMFDESSKSNSFPPIHVKSGGISDIGGLVWVNLGDYKKVLLSVHHPELDEKTKIVKDQISAFLSDKNINTWKPGIVAKPVDITLGSANMGLVVDLMFEYARQQAKPQASRPLIGIGNGIELFHEVKRLQPPITRTGVAGPHGEQYFGADLGQVRVRAQDGSWSTLDTGTLESITAVAIDHQMLFAATLNGGILERKSSGWTRIASMPDKQVVLALTHADHGWIILTGDFLYNNGVRLPFVKTMKVYEADDEFSKINIIKNVQPDYARIVKTNPIIKNNKYWLNVYDNLYYLDLSSKTWKTKSPDHDISSFNIDKKSGIFTAYKRLGIFSKLSISGDEGETWSKVNNTGIGIQDIIFTSKTQANAVGFDHGLLNSSIGVYKFDEPSKELSAVSLAQAGLCHDFISDEDMRLFFCISGNGSILRFDDNTLVPEFILN